MQVSSRPPSLPRQLSNNQIYVDHEVTVVTAFSDAPPRPPSTSTTAKPSFEHLRSNSSNANRQHPGSIASAISRIREANSRTTTMDSQLPRPLSPPQRPSFNTQRTSATGRQYIDAETQSMRELADFLKNKQPPKENYMSIPDAISVPEKDRSSLGMFRRKSKQRQSVQEPANIRLPDSAVAARTTDGHWHIAISIPNEYYPAEGLPSGVQEDSASVKSIQRPRAATKNSFGAVTVLKPVNEERPLSMSDAGPSRNTNTIISRVFSDERPRTAESKALDRRIADLTAVKEIIAEKEAVERELAAIKGLAAQKEHAAQEEQAIREALALENARALDIDARKGPADTKNGNNEPHMQYLDERPRPQAGSTNRVPSKPRRAFIGIPPDEFQRQSSVRSDKRHSGGTVYSERSMTSDNSPATVATENFQKGHARDISIVSSVPSMSDAVIGTAQVGTSIVGHLEPPNRLSSKAPTANLVEVVTTDAPDVSGRTKKRTSTQLISPPPNGMTRAQMPGSRLSAVEPAYSGTSSFRERPLSTEASSTGRPLSEGSPGPAPTRGLPELPLDSPSRHSSKRSGKSGRRSRPTSTIGPLDDSALNTRSSSPSDEVSENNSGNSQDTIREQRKRRVRAIRSRDVAAERTRNSFVEAPNTAKLRSPSGQKGRPQVYLSVPGTATGSDNQINISAIMCVASIVPDFATYTILGPALGISPITAPPVEPTVQHLISSYRSASSQPGPQSRSASPAPTNPSDEVHEPNYVPATSRLPAPELSGSTPRTLLHHYENSPVLTPGIEARLANLERNQEIILQSLTSVLTLGQSLASISEIISARPARTPSQSTSQSSALPEPPFYPSYPRPLIRQNTQPLPRTAPSAASTPQIDLTPWERELLERFERDRGSVVREVGRGLGDIEGLMHEVVGNSRISAEMSARESSDINGRRSGGFEGETGPFAGF